MDEKLRPISLQLSRLEKGLIEEYTEIKAAAGPDLMYAVLPRERARGYLDIVASLSEALQATGDPRNLHLVTELHDQLRIRIMILRDLLEREVPVPYIERTVAEIRDPQFGTAPSTPARPTAHTTTETPEPTKGWFRQWLARLPLIGRLFPERPAATTGGHRTVQLGPADEGPAKQAPPLAKEVMQTMGLHYLMEEDQLNLIKSGQELPRITHDHKLPASFARFVSVDLAETHFATRASDAIARTPEELRRKLAERAGRPAK